jgi:phospholipid/cholesterol/gamma-HCH transport system substrate-binding protein
VPRLPLATHQNPMEADKRYFLEGLFVIVLAVGVALGFLWLSRSGDRDDVLYRIHFTESVSGMAPGDPVKFNGVNVGTVETMAVDLADPRRVRVDVRLHRGTPVRTDTRAVLKLKGLTGTVFVELSGASPQSTELLAATPAGQVPEIPADRSSLATVIDMLPEILDKFSALESQTGQAIGKVAGLEKDAKKVLRNINEVTEKVKEDPSLLLRRPKKPPEEEKRHSEEIRQR